VNTWMVLKDDKHRDGRLSMWHFKGWFLSVREDNNRHPNNKCHATFKHLFRPNSYLLNIVSKT
jgi:hypothetical protein